MKSMKRLLAILLTVCMLASCLCITAFAETAKDVKVSLVLHKFDDETIIGDEYAKTDNLAVGDMVIAAVRAKVPSGKAAMSSAQYQIDYDSDKLELYSQSTKSRQPFYNKSYDNADLLTSDWTIVINDKTAGKYEVGSTGTANAESETDTMDLLYVAFKVKSAITAAETGILFNKSFATGFAKLTGQVSNPLTFDLIDPFSGSPTPPPVTKTLSSIAVTTAPSKTEYVYNEDFAPAGMVVTATYDDQSTSPVTAYTVTDGKALSVGKTSVTISYTEGDVTKTATQKITVGKATATVKTNPTATVTYDDNVSDSVLTGGAMEYNDTEVPGTFKWADSVTLSGYGDVTAPGATKDLDVVFTPTDTTNYNKAETVAKVVVNQAEPDVGEVSQIAKLYPDNSLEDAATALDNGGIAIGSFTVTGKTPLETGEYDYTFTPDDSNYKTVTDKVTLTITPDTVEKIEITTNPTTTEYVYGGTIDTTGMVVKATYASGRTVDDYKNYSIDPEQVLTVGDPIAITVKSTDVTTVTTSFNVKVGKATPTVKTPLTASVTYDDTVDDSDIEGAMDVAGTFAWASGTTTYGDAGTTTLKADFTPGDVTNYNVVQNIDVAVTVAQAEPDVGTVSQNGALYPSNTLAEAAAKLTNNGKTTGTFTLTGATPLVTGTYNYTFTPTDTNFKAVTDTVTLTVTQPPLVSIAVTTAPNKTAYVYNEDFDPTGMVVTATYDDQFTSPVTTYTVTDGKALSVGKTSVTISYTEGEVTKTTTQTITVAKAASDVGNVWQGEAIYPSDKLADAAAKLTKDGKTEGTFTLRGAEPLATGTYNWTFTPQDTVNFESATGTVRLTVTADALAEVKVMLAPTKTDYVYGDTIDTTGMKVKATYASGAVNEDYKAYTVSPTTLTTIGLVSITVTSTEDPTKTDTFNVSVDKATYPYDHQTTLNSLRKTPYSIDVSAQLAEGTSGVTCTDLTNGAIFQVVPSIPYPLSSNLFYGIWDSTEIGQTATATFTVSGEYYKDYTIKFFFVVVDKNPADVSGVQLSKSVYNYGESYRVIGTPVASVDGSPVEVENWKYELKYYDTSSVWVDAENTEKIGDYKLVVSIDDPNYMGSTELKFKVQPLVTLQKGGEIKFTAETTDVLGNFDFGAQIIPAGTYNLVHETADRIVTKLYYVDGGVFSGSMDVSIGSSSNSCVVIEDPQAWKVCVGGLDALAEAELGGMPGSVQLVINSQTVDPSDSAKLAELSEAAGKSLQCMNVRITKTEGGMVQPDITDTNGYPVTMVVPFNPAVMKDIVVLRCHNGVAEAMPTSTMGNDFFLVDYENGEITIVSTLFSTFAIAYTPADPFYPVYPVYPVTPVPVVEQFVILPSELELTSFYDVVQGDWFYDAVYYCQRMGLMTGTSYRTFSPNGTTTRAMIMTILARQSGVDTQGLVWYERGVEWCRNVGISDGSNPMADITREQFAAMLYRYAQFRNLNTTVRGSLAGFKDAAEVSSYAVTAVQWAVDNGIITGSNGYLLPKATATRAQVAAMFYRFLLNF